MKWYYDLITQLYNNIPTEKKDVPRSELLKDYYNNKYLTSPIYYNGRVMLGSNTRFRVDVRDFFSLNDENLNSIVTGLNMSTQTDNQKALTCLKWIIQNFPYKSDKTNYKQGEFWCMPYESIAKMSGDCFAGYEEIYTEDGLKKIKDIKIGDMALSYDFDKKDYVYKKIINHWNKGELQINRVHLRNGQWFDVTEDHPMWHRIGQKESIYEKQKLSDIDLSKWCKRKIPIAIKIPYNESTPKWDIDLYKVIGHYLAEGFKDKNGYSVDSSGYELIEDIIPILEEYNIPFSEYKNNSGVPCIRFLKSDFKNYLKNLKENSFDINLSEEILCLPVEYLEALLYGMWLGDGTKVQYKDKRGYMNNKQWTYSTSSKKLADDIQRIGLHLGRTFHIWKQDNHGGVGNKPIYRINYNPNSFFLRDHGYKDISEVSISYIEKLESTEMFDLTVEDTHTVILKNGAILHQCEDGAILLANLLIIAGIPEWKIRVNCGFVFEPKSKTQVGHAYLTFFDDEKERWVIVDWCYYANLKKIIDREEYKKESMYQDLCFSFHSTGSWGRDADIRKMEGFK